MPASRCTAIRLARLGPATTLLIACLSNSWAAPLAEWDFEPPEPFVDRIGGVKLAPLGGIGVVEVQDGADAVRGHALALPGKNDHVAVTRELAPISESFTLEAEIRLSSLPGQRLGYSIAQQGRFGNPANYGWIVMVRMDGGLDSQPHELVALVSDGKAFQQAGSGILLADDIDYRIRVAFDLEARELRFAVSRIDAPDERQERSVPLTLATLNARPGLFVGDSLGQFVDASFLGSIHHLRLSLGASPP